MRKRLTNDQIAAIVADPRPQVDIAMEYNITQAHVSLLKKLAGVEQIRLTLSAQQLGDILDALSWAIEDDSVEFEQRKRMFSLYYMLQPMEPDTKE